MSDNHSKETFYVTTPIYYVNSLPHLGHLYTMIAADCVARHKRQQGIETLFLTGTDEHGISIERAAERAGRTPKAQADYIVSYYKKMTAEFGLDREHGGYDIFMRTTEPFHYAGVSEFWRQVARAKTPKGNEAIYKGHYEGWFCAACAAYKTEDEYLKSQNADEPPTCLVHETALDRVSEESYFFRLSDYGDALLELYESRSDFVLPESRRNEVASFVRGGLQDLSVSRPKSSVSWGVPVPDDPNHTMYVWFDALTNYITALGYGNQAQEGAVSFGKFWPALHFVGKDILRFHAVYWPAFLMAAGLEQPRSIVAHGMWLDPDGRKMGKSLGNAIDLEVLNRYFTIDSLRYFCLREMVFGQDGRFGYEGVIDRANSDLASGLGNLSSRTLTMLTRYCGGFVPSGNISEDKRLLAKRSGIDADESTIASFIEHARDEYLLLLDSFAFSRALEVAWSIIAHVDKMISGAKPWDLAKDETQRQTLNAVLYRAAEALRWICVLLYPVMPEATRNIYSQLGLTDALSRLDPANLRWGGLAEKTQVGEVTPVFPRIDKKKVIDEIKSQTAIPEAPERAANAATVGETIPADGTPSPAVVADSIAGVATFIEIGDFAKVDLRVGQVLTAERVPKADKLLLMTIDIGEDKPRQVLAGIAEYYEAAALVGRKLVVVANLKPRKLRGYESQGMVVAASVGEGGRPVIATFTEDVPNGARLK